MWFIKTRYPPLPMRPYRATHGGKGGAILFNKTQEHRHNWRAAS